MTKTVLPIYRHNLMIYPHWKTRILLFHQFMFKFWSFSKVKRSFTVQSKSLATTRRALLALKRLRKSWAIQLPWRRNKMDGWKRDGTIPWWSYDVTILVPTLLSFKETNFQICVLRGFWRYETNFIKFTLFAVAFSNQIAPTLSMLFRTCRTLRPSWLRLPQCEVEVWRFGCFFGFVSQRLPDSWSLGERSNRKDEVDWSARSICEVFDTVLCVHGRSSLLFQLALNLRVFWRLLKYFFQWDCQSFTFSDAEDLWKNSWRMPQTNDRLRNEQNLDWFGITLEVSTNWLVGELAFYNLIRFGTHSFCLQRQSQSLRSKC